jgi:hypothetical protein
MTRKILFKDLERDAVFAIFAEMRESNCNFEVAMNNLLRRGLAISEADSAQAPEPAK